MLTESGKLFLATWFFLREAIKAAIVYFNENSAPKQDQIKGVGLRQRDKLPEKLPTAVEIKRALPKHCFQPTVARSMLYVVRDALQVISTYSAIQYIHSIPNPYIYWTSMVFYWAVQGTFFTALFVVGHDCGHDSFSNHGWLNDVVGTIFHGFLMTPYYCWKLTHRVHHKNNANMDKDEVFYPVRKREPAAGKFVLPGFGFGLGWWFYLLIGYAPRQVPHFNVKHQVFTGHVFGCVMSVAAFCGMGYLCYLYTLAHGVFALVCYYVVPLFIFASYTVVITFLHHSEMNIPWYTDGNWDFVKGQLSTVDRNYGVVHYVIHSIGTHQMHHMFTKIPHYHLEEATRAFRAAFPQLVRVCDEPILPSFMRMFTKYEKQACGTDNDITELRYK